MAKLGYIFEIREIRKFYSYIFNFDRLVMYKEYDFETINLCKIFIATANQLSLFNKKKTKLGCDFIKRSLKIVLDLDRYCINMHIN